MTSNFNATAPATTMARTTATAAPSGSLVPCDLQMTCNQVLSATDAKCFRFNVGSSYTQAPQASQQTWTSLGLPNNGDKYMTGCMSKKMLASGLNGQMQWNSWGQNSNMQDQGALMMNGQEMFIVYQAVMSQKQSQNGNNIVDYRFVETRGKGNKMAMGFRAKIMDFFYYAMVQGTAGDTKESCSDVCGKGFFSQKCCATIAMGPEVMYACLDRSAVPADMTMNVAGVNVDVTCVVGSGAMKVAASAAALSALFVTAI